MSTGRGLAKAATVIMMATLFGRFIGFIREMVIANKFGASLATDAYVIAYTIPSMVAMALAGAFNSAFLPVFNDHLVNKDKADAQKLANTIISLVTVFFVILIGAAVTFAPQIVSLLVDKDFGREGIDITIKLFRIILPALLFIGLMGLVSAILNSFKHFLFPAAGPMVTSLAAIAFVLLFAKDWGIVSLAVGTLVGFGLQFLMQLPVMHKKGFRYRPSFDLGHPGVRRVLVLMMPVLLGVIVSQSAVFVERNLASALDVGSVSALNYANRVMQLPLGLFVTAISIPIFPALSVYASKKEYGQLKETLVKGINFFFIILVPATIGLIALNQPIIKLLFEHGQFTAENTLVTAYALAFYALAILPWALKDILTRSFYALQDTLSPVVISVLGAVATIVFDIFLVRTMGVGGLALGFALGQAVNMVVLYLVLQKKLGRIEVHLWLTVLLKVLVAGVLMAAAVYFGYGIMEQILPGTSRKNLLFNIAVSGIIGLIVYFTAVVALKVREIADLLRMLSKIKERFIPQK